jgi:hypothetical protein
VTFVRQPVLRGQRLVSGYLLNGPDRGTQAINLWRSGSTLWSTASGALVLRLPDPVPARCELGRPTPLVEIEGRLVALELAGFDLTEPPPRSIVHLWHGQIVVETGLTPVDPTSLLDLTDWHLTPPARPESPPRPAAARPTEPPLATPDAEFDARQALGDHQKPTSRDRRRQRKVQAQENNPSQRQAIAGKPARRSGGWLAKRRHQKYLNDLSKLFDSNRVEEALRLAIPLGGTDGPTARGRFKPRRDLTLRPRRPNGRSTVKVQPGLRNQLQNHYRQAFIRLDRQGRTLDAAFVLADLLNRVGEACSYLERNQQVRLAAELSEARATDHAETVRLWWRAGDRNRAIVIARRHGCFAAAITRLERSQMPDQASELRRAWTSQLLEAGDIVGAYDVIGTQHDDTSTAIKQRLIEIGTENSGPVRARMLARQLRARHQAPHPALSALISDPQARPEREVLATELTSNRQKLDHPHTARSLLRALLAEPTDLSAKTLEALTELSADPILREDLPPLEEIEQRRSLPVTNWIEIAATDRGQIPVRDARVLPDGRLVVSLAGVGIRIIKPSGKTEVEFDLPADELVLSDNGLRLLALRRLDEGVLGVSQIALPERRIRIIGDIPATTWAQTYDGAAWYHANGSHLVMLDMLADGPSALWRQTEHPDLIYAIARDPTQLAVGCISSSPHGMQPLALIRRYLLPSLRELPATRDVIGNGPVLQPNGSTVQGEAVGGGCTARIESVTEEARTIVVAKQGTDVPVAVIRLMGGTWASTRIDNSHLVVADSLGRVETIDLRVESHQSYRATI